MTPKKLIIATRKSPLAVKQAYLVRDLLLKAHPHLSIDFLGITTQADKMLTISLNKIGGKGLFVKELEEALLDRRAHLAVHSMKDVPTELPKGLIIAAMTQREDPRDTFISAKYSSYQQLPPGARVGTSSLRRQLQFKTLCPHADLMDLRGNIQTRIKRMINGDYEAIILASAGLKRMGLADEIREFFSIDDMLPAAGQGVLGVECRADDDEMRPLLTAINDTDSVFCVLAERALTRFLGGGCSSPIASYAELQGEELILRAFVGSLKKETLRAMIKGQKVEAEKLGQQLAEQLIAQGAKERLQEFQ